MAVPSYERTVDVAVVGAGVVGLGIAWTAARSGRTVAVVDPAPASGATFAAAGMLAPVSELQGQEDDLLELSLASAALYPAFVAPLDADGPGTGYRTTRTLLVGADAGDRQALADLYRRQLEHGLSVSPLSIREARTLEPLLGPQLSSAYDVEHDHQVDPRRLAAALEAGLAAIAERDGWTHPPSIRRTAVGLLHEHPHDPGSRVHGVTLDDGTALQAGEVIVANGMGASRVAGMPPGLALPLRAVHGDILRLRVPDQLRPLLTATIRGLVHGNHVYLVPRSDGTLVVGATQREDGVEGVSAGGVHRLLRDAQVLLPAVAELELLETCARARPGTPDNAPLLGRVARGGARAGDVPGLIIATGFFRNGVLLTPIAARTCLELLDDPTEPGRPCFRPDRFSPTHLQGGRP